MKREKNSHGIQTGGVDVVGFVVDGAGEDTKLLFDGEYVHGSGIKAAEFRDEGRYFITFFEPPPARLLLANLAETDARVELLWLFEVEMSLLDQPWRAEVQIHLDLGNIEVTLQPVWDAWTSAVSYNALQRAVAEAAGSIGASASETDDGMNITLQLLSKHCDLGHLLQTTSERLETIFEDALKLAATRVPTSVLKVFNFHPAVASACEQYLIYFAEFLRDMGVNVVADIRHAAGAVLFSVTPATHDVALDAIRTALDVYLRLPVAEFDGNPAALAEQIATDKLTMNVYHLKSQLASAALMLRLQDATISAQQCTIEAQKALIQASTGEERDSEPIIKDILEVVPVESSGVRINLPAVWRRIKGLFV